MLYHIKYMKLLRRIKILFIADIFKFCVRNKYWTGNHSLVNRTDIVLIDSLLKRVRNKECLKIRDTFYTNKKKSVIFSNHPWYYSIPLSVAYLVISSE